MNHGRLLTPYDYDIPILCIPWKLWASSIKWYYQCIAANLTKLTGYLMKTDLDQVIEQVFG